MHFGHVKFSDKAINNKAHEIVVLSDKKIKKLFKKIFNELSEDEGHITKPVKSASGLTDLIIHAQHNKPHNEEFFLHMDEEEHVKEFQNNTFYVIHKDEEFNPDIDLNGLANKTYYNKLLEMEVMLKDIQSCTHKPPNKTGKKVVISPTSNGDSVGKASNLKVSPQHPGKAVKNTPDPISKDEQEKIHRNLHKTIDSILSELDDLPVLPDKSCADLDHNETENQVVIKTPSKKRMKLESPEYQHTSKIGGMSTESFNDYQNSIFTKLNQNDKHTSLTFSSLNDMSTTADSHDISTHKKKKKKHKHSHPEAVF